MPTDDDANVLNALEDGFFELYLTDGRYEMMPSPEWIEFSEIRATSSLIEFFGFDETTDLDLQLLNLRSSSSFRFAVGNCLNVERLILDTSLFIQLTEGTTMKVRGGGDECVYRQSSHCF